MNLLKLLLSASALMFASMAFGSGFAIRLTDYALPGIESRFEMMGFCNETGQYEPIDFCYTEGPSFSLNLLEATDKSLRFKVDNLIAFTAFATDYDYYVTFKESGNNPAQADDLLRVQFKVLDAIDREFSGVEFIVSLISGSIVQDYLDGLPASAVGKGQFVNDVNESLRFLGPDPFHFGDEYGPHEALPGKLFDGLIVVPTAVAEPPMLATALAAWLALGAAGCAGRQRLRRMT